MEDFYCKTEFGKLFDDFQNSFEMEIYDYIQALNFSFKVFQGNFEALVKWLEMGNQTLDNYLDSWGCNDKEKDRLFLDEVFRLLHNFLASAKSLVDHTRRIIGKLYSNHEFGNEYKNRKDNMIDDVIVKFVQELRNYTLHCPSPMLKIQRDLHKPSSLEVKLDATTLKKWSGWEKAIDYVNHLNSDISVTPLVFSYFYLIREFYDWLFERQQDLHKADFERLKSMYENLYT